MQQTFLVGSYTHPSMDGRGQGLYTCSLDVSTGEMNLLDTTNINNPSYFIFSKNQQYLFLVEESRQDLQPHVRSLKYENSTLNRLSHQPMSGDYACHLALDASQAFLVVTNYGTGNSILYEVEDGRITKQLDEVQHQGHSLNPQRQEAAHAHAAVFSPDNKYVFIVDLGLDAIKTYTFDSGTFEYVTTLRTKSGAGPRHMVFHPNQKHGFVLNELDSTLMLVRYKDEHLTEVATLVALPKDYRGESTAAAIHVSPNAKHVYTSNRGHDSIAVFSFDEATEHLELIQHMSSGGHFPRDFAIDPTGRLLVTTHQKSDDLYSFWIDESGRLEPTGHSLKLGTPVCIKMLK